MGWDSQVYLYIYSRLRTGAMLHAGVRRRTGWSELGGGIGSATRRKYIDEFEGVRNVSSVSMLLGKRRPESTGMNLRDWQIGRHRIIGRDL